MGDLILSRYAKIFQEDETWWLFHSASGTVAQLTEEFIHSDEFHKLRVNLQVSNLSNNPVIQQMLDLGILVKEEDLNQEVEKVKSDICKQIHNPEALELIILPTEKCNFRCVYCYEDFLKGIMKPEIIKGVKKYASTSLDKQTRKLVIQWFGGEPLAAKHAVFELSEHFQKITQEHDIAYQAIMTTNGYLLDVDTFSSLFALGIKSYQITLDGPSAIHDTRRPLRGGAGTFQKIWDGTLACDMLEIFVGCLLVQFPFGSQSTPQMCAKTPFFSKKAPHLGVNLLYASPQISQSATNNSFPITSRGTIPKTNK